MRRVQRSVDFTQGAARAAPRFGWAKYNQRYWLHGDYDDFLRFFFAEVFSEPHSTKQIEDCVGRGQEIAPQTLVDITVARLGCHGAVCASNEAVCPRVQCPVLVVRGIVAEAGYAKI